MSIASVYKDRCLGFVFSGCVSYTAVMMAGRHECLRGLQASNGCLGVASYRIDSTAVVEILMSDSLPWNKRCLCLGNFSLFRMTGIFIGLATHLFAGMEGDPITNGEFNASYFVPHLLELKVNSSS